MSDARAQGYRHAIATPHATATAIGDDVFRAGGNAFDAAIAAAAALTVCYPHMCAVGGDILALAATPDGAVRAVNGSGAAPVAASAGRLRERGLGEMPLTGAEAVTVPGAVAAWETLHALGASRPLADLLEPAARLAEEGLPLAPGVARALAAEATTLAADAGLAGVFFPSGAPLAAGDLLRQPALGRTFRALQAGGAAALYRGEIGAAIVAHLRSVGSPMTADDLAAHATEVTDPISLRFRDEEILTAPPNCQGLLLLEILGAIEALGDADVLGADADLIAEIFRLATLDRTAHLGDPRHVSVPVSRLLSPAHAAALAAAARERRSNGGLVGPPEAAPRPTGDTVALVAADADGNALSVIQSIFHSFGSGILEPETGVILHNRGGFFSLDESSPNLLAGGRRPAHTLMPVLVRRDGRLVGVHGTMGGKVQPQIHAHLVLRAGAGEDPAVVVAAPRFVVGGLEAGSRDDIVIAETGCSAAARAAWRRAGFEVQDRPDHDEEVGHSHVIRIDADGLLRVASDPRSDGAAAAD